MPHIHTKPGQHDNTASAFIVRYEDGKPLAMLIMHKKLHTLLQPGGHIELDETPWQAMAHELEEETGYRLSALNIWQPRQRMRNISDISVHPQPILSNTHSVPGNHFHADLDYLFIAETLPSARPHEGESTDIRWLSYEQIKALPDDQVMQNAREIYEYIFEQALNDESWEAVSATSFSLGHPLSID